MTTTHMSTGRRRRQRLRRTLLVAPLLVVAGGAAGYAAWHLEDSGAPSVSGSSASAPQSSGAKSAPARAKPRPKPTSGSASGTVDGAKSAGGKGFSPVVTNRIPAPMKRLPLSAPIPGTTNMQASAAAAFERAFAAARADGLTPEIRSAWRSEQWQQILFDRAVTQYGSTREASKWVLSPVKSAHVKGYAIDVHPQAVASWLEEHGSAFGLCRTYDNEWWHFEYLATSTCPVRQPTAAG